MPFDTIAMAAVVDELTPLVIGAHIQRVIQPEALSVALSLYGGGEQRWLVLSADPRYARVSLSSQRLAKAFPTPSAFVMLLRKHLEGTRVKAMEQTRWERVFTLTCGSEGRAVRLVVEVMGKHSNVVLVDGESRVLGALKLISPRQSRVRQILPGRLYQTPPERAVDSALYPPGPRPDPLDGEVDLVACLNAVPAGTPISAALLGLLPGCSPFLAGQIARRAGVQPHSPVNTAPVDALLAATLNLYGLYQTGAWRPCIFEDARGRPDFAPYLPLGVEQTEETANMSAAIDNCYGAAASSDSLSASRAVVEKEIERARRAAERRVSSLHEGLAASAGAEEIKTRGQLLLAYQYEVTAGAQELEIPDLGTVIPLDPSLSPPENAERLFRRYRKLRDAARRIPALLVEAESERARLDELAIFAGLATSEGSLRDLSEQIHPAAGPNGRSKKTPKRGPLRFQRDNLLLILGRNARENEEVTFRLAQREDLWLHARGRTGAHALLRGAGSEPAPHTLASAASVVAYFSEGRNDTYVDVDVTGVRAVRKVAGGPPGRVTYRGETTVRVKPGLGDWQPLSGAASNRR